MPRTLRELVWAYRGREYAEWERLSVLLCAVINPHRDKSKKPSPFLPTDFFRRPGTKGRPRGTPLTAGAFKAMRGLFVKKKEQ